MGQYKHNLKAFCQLIGVHPGEFVFLSNNARKWYHYDTQRKPTGGTRIIAKPKWRLKQVQAKVHSFLISGIDEAILYGGVRRRSARMAAQLHTAQSTVLSLDITNYYGSINHQSIFKVFRNYFGFNNHLASRLTKLTTIHGSLPQGAPTSTLLANAHAITTWSAEVQQICEKRGATLTIFVDDITISGSKDILSLIADVKHILAKFDLALNENKSRYMPAGTRQEILGYTTNCKVSKNKKWRNNVRAAVHQISVQSTLAGEEQQRQLRSTIGKLAHAKEVNPGFADREKRKLLKK